MILSLTRKHPQCDGIWVWVVLHAEMHAVPGMPFFHCWIGRIPAECGVAVFNKVFAHITRPDCLLVQI
jgi:hypothetical protein